ncbi:MAG: hypothetical protein KDA89_16935 [Planctomycetaceae bacterium]|nr:hypothetical protein [Planctomycetaceae bacterium]
MQNFLLILTVTCFSVCSSARGQESGSAADPAPRDPITAALLSFQERAAAAKGMGPQITDLLFSRLITFPEVYLVEREELDKVLAEQQLSLSGAVLPEHAVRVGQLTGAKVLVTGSVFRVERTVHVVAKLISTETGRVLGASVSGIEPEGVEKLAEQLAEKIAETLNKQGGSLVASDTKPVDRIARLKLRFRKAYLPRLWIEVSERHIGQPSVDPAAQTELMRIAQAVGFEVADSSAVAPSETDVIITGAAFSEFASRHGNLTSVKARVELRATQKSGEVLATDRQTTIALDLAEHTAGKTALQDAARDLAERMFPVIVGKR